MILINRFCLEFIFLKEELIKIGFGKYRIIVKIDKIFKMSICKAVFKAEFTIFLFLTNCLNIISFQV